jgi:small subunit ribosomal protein S6e
MINGILTNLRVRILMTKGSKFYRPRRVGERRRKSARGCIVGPDLSTLNLVIVSKGEADIVGLTDADSARPRRLGPKRANKIRKLFNLTKEDDVRKFVISRSFTTRKGKNITKRPKIQRLVTPLTLQRKRALVAEKRENRERGRKEAAEYERLKAQRSKEKRASEVAAKMRRSSRKDSAKQAA